MGSFRLVSAGLAALLAVAAAGLLLAAQWGVAVEYGFGRGTLLAGFVVVPLLAGVAAAALAGWSRPWLIGLAVLAALLALGIPVAGVLGQREKEARAQEADARFHCNSTNSELHVPAQVDAGWRQLPRAAPHWLYGPIEGTRNGCTAALAGDPDAAFAAWRSALIDGDGVVTVDEPGLVVLVQSGRRVELRREVEIATLTLTTPDGGCRVPADDGSVRGC